MLTDLADTLRAAGVDVAEEPGWKTRGHGPMVDVQGVTCHHTGGLKDLGVVRDGRPDLAGPLAHIWLSRTGTAHVVAAGLCWHAGPSQRPGQTNSHRIGIEAEALGTGAASDWPDVQMVAYRRICAALMARYGFPVGEVLGHKETCAPHGRKPDPSFDMDQFRHDITQGEDMQPTDKVTLTKAQAAALTAGGHQCAEGDQVSWAWLWLWGGPGDYTTRHAVLDLSAKVDALAAQVAKLSIPTPPVIDVQALAAALAQHLPTNGDPQAIAQAVAADLAARLQS